MSVKAEIQVYSKADAVLIPRTAVTWQGDIPYCRVIENRKHIRLRKLKLGRANVTHHEVLEGVSPGEQVAVE
jgi:multidrug efflux pump subunit AcrA (membrane-fusion protein)